MERSSLSLFLSIFGAYQIVLTEIMYPDLSYLFHDLFGTQPDNWTSIFKTFGLLLVLSILLAAFMLYIELKRKQAEGLFTGTRVKVVEGQAATPLEIGSNALFGFILGFKLIYIFQNFSEFQEDAAAVLLSGKGSWGAGLLLAALFGAYRWWEKNRQKLDKPKEVVRTIYPHDRIGDITVVAAVSGILGAKIFAIIEYMDQFLEDPVGTFFSGSGLAIYGGLIGGYLGLAWYLRKHKIPFFHFADAIAPALMIAYGTGRLGCQLSGDGDWGDPAPAQPDWWFLPDWLWSWDYPRNVAQEGVRIPDCTFEYCSRLPELVYPTPLFEVIMALALGAFLWSIRTKFKVPGFLFFIYLILNGVERFVIELIRINEDYNVLGFKLSQAQIIALLFILVGIAGALFMRKQHKAKAG